MVKPTEPHDLNRHKIIGANVNSSASKEGLKRKDQNAKEFSPFTLSEEFKAFWGNSLDPKWFHSRQILSPFPLFITCLTLIIFYICSDLLFSPRELFNGLLNKKNTSHAIEEQQQQQQQETSILPDTAPGEIDKETQEDEEYEEGSLETTH